VNEGEKMTKQELVEMMVGLLQDILDEHAEGEAVQAAVDLQLVGEEASVTSMALVSFITDVEATIDETWDVEMSLVSESALSREKSPFRHIDALSDYVLELSRDGAG
jgi:hypothetical protein